MEKINIVVAGDVGCGRKTLIKQLFSKVEYKTNQQQTDHQKEVMLSISKFPRDDIGVDFQSMLQTSYKTYNFSIPNDYVDFFKIITREKIKADAAILIIDASKSIYKQILEYAYLFSAFGTKQAIIVINKMDLKHYNRFEFLQISEEISGFFKILKMKIAFIIPISAEYDDNITAIGTRMNWYTSPTLMESLDYLSAPKNLAQFPLRVIVQSCNFADNMTKILVKVSTGTLFSGHQLTFGPVHHTTRVLSIEEISGKKKTSAESGELVSLVLENTGNVSRGQVGFNNCHPPLITDRLTTDLFWIYDKPLQREDKIYISCGTNSCSGQIEKISDIRDLSCPEVKLNYIEQLAQLQFATVLIKLDSPICIDLFSDLPDLGRFSVFQNNKILGGGIFK